MIRILLSLLIAGSLAARASDFISAPEQGASATVSQPHVTAELIPEMTTVQPGQPFDVALHLHMDSSWHTYWTNPGDAGIATTITWTLPPGFTAGPIQWPTPEKHPMGPLITYGYAGDVYLLTTITPPKSVLPRQFDLKAHAEWLVCKEECIPGKADLTVPLDSGLLNFRLPVENKDFFDQARARLPVENTRWEVKAAYGKGGGTVDNQQQALWMLFMTKAGASTDPVGNLYFFPEQANVLSANESDNGPPEPDKKISGFEWPLTLQQNGEKPAQVSGVLVSDRPLIRDSKSVYIPAFSTDARDVSMVISRTGMSLGAASLETFAYPQAAGSEQTAAQRAAATPTATTEAQPWLIAVLGAAFIGGLILNLMPCVLPVLSLKVFSLMKHAGENPRAAWIQGVAFTAGVVLSFWVLAGLLLVLRAAGNQLGWGFQMQSPGFVLALIFLFFLLGLNLFGVFELGASLVGLDAKATGHLGGVASSFGNGALATLAATPCTAPFMGSSLGFAAQQPPFVAMLIFTFLALGMATPYLLLTIFPGALRFVPKPGAWMEAFKQFMGFLLMATVIFLVYVFGALVGDEHLPYLLFLLLLSGLAAWVYGRWANPAQTKQSRALGLGFALLLLYFTFTLSLSLANTPPSKKSTGKYNPTRMWNVDWQPWSQAAVDQTLTQGKPVFVDFTAAWCLSCKVNEALALDTDSVRQAFVEKKVVLFRADWTHSDPEITKALREYHRDGVPLYLLYSPQDREKPQVLPEVLTPGIVLDALKKL